MRINSVQEYLSKMGRIDVIARDNLIAWWKMNLTDSSTVMDSIGSTHSTLLSNCSIIDGLNGQTAIKTNNGYIKIGSNNALIAGKSELSGSIWIKQDTHQSNPLLSDMVHSPDQESISFGLYNAHPYIRIINSGGQAPMATANTFIADTWKQWNIAFTFKQNDVLKLYVNGVLDMTATTGDYPIKTCAYSFYIGGNPYPGDSYLRMQNLMLWNKALSAEEIYAVYAVDATREQPKRIAIGGLKLEADSNPLTAVLTDVPAIADGDRISSASATLWYPQYSYGIYFSEPKEVKSLRVYCQHGGGITTGWYATNNDSVYVYSSMNGVNWTPVCLFHAPPIITHANNTACFILNLPFPVTAKYFKIRNHEGGSYTLASNPGGASFYIVEVEAYGDNKLLTTGSYTETSVPTSIPDLALWLDANSVDATNGQTIEYWPSKSPFNRHAVMSTIGARPTFVTNAVNNLPAIQFGNSQYMNVMNGGSILQNKLGATFFCVCNTVGSDSQYDAVLTFSTTDPVLTRLALLRNSSGSVQIGGRRLDADSYSVVSGSTYTLNQQSIDNYVIDYEHAVVRGNTNGASDMTAAFKTPGATSNTASTNVMIGYLLNAGYYQGNITEIIVYNRVLSEPERQQVYTYLSTKYAI